MKKIIINSILILLFLTIPILSSPDFDGTLRMFHVPMFQKSFVTMLLLILFFYINYFYFFPKFVIPQKYFLYTSILIISYLLIWGIPTFIISHNLPIITHNTSKTIASIPPHKMRSVGPIFNFFTPLLPFCFAVLGSFFLSILLQKREAEAQKNRAELLNLRYQLQPHFLFNILNSIYSLSIFKSDETPESILKLSNVMRYVVNESHKDFVSLNDELHYLKDYISLQKIRTDESLNFSLKMDIKNEENLKIAPMILVNFIENAFKYGFNPEENSIINISLKTADNILFFNISNKIVIKQLPANETTKIGIKNTLDRLKEIYPQKHQIEIKETADRYVVNLKLTLESLAINT